MSNKFTRLNYCSFQLLTGTTCSIVEMNNSSNGSSSNEIASEIQQNLVLQVTETINIKYFIKRVYLMHFIFIHDKSGMAPHPILYPPFIPPMLNL